MAMIANPPGFLVFTARRPVKKTQFWTVGPASLFSGFDQASVPCMAGCIATPSGQPKPSLERSMQTLNVRRKQQLEARREPA